MAGSCALISNGLSRRARWPLGTAGSPTPSAYFRREYITVVAVFCRDVSLRNTRLPPAFHLALPTCPLRANRPVACYNSSAKFNEIKKESPAQGNESRTEEHWATRARWKDLFSRPSPRTVLSSKNTFHRGMR